MATNTRRAKPSGSKGLTVKTFKGLNKKRMASKGNGGNSVRYKQGETVVIQFLTEPEGFREFEQHVWQDGTWNYVPCTGDDCPLCDNESRDISKTGYRFSAVVYNHGEKRVQVLDGPKDLATRVFAKYERKPALFRKRVWDVSKLATTPVSYSVDEAEQAPVNPRNLELIDLEEHLESELKRYYGDDLENIQPDSTALEDDAFDDDDFDDPVDEEAEEDDWDEDDEESEGYDEDELLAMTSAELIGIAKEAGVSAATVQKAKAKRSKEMLVKAILRVS